MGSLAGFRNRRLSGGRGLATGGTFIDPGRFSAPARETAQFGSIISEIALLTGGRIQQKKRQIEEEEVREVKRLGRKAETKREQTIKKRNNELAHSEFEDMKATVAIDRNKFLRGLRTTDADYNEINKNWQKDSRDSFKAAAKRGNQPDAKQDFADYGRGIKPRWDRDIDNIAWAVSSARAKVKLFNAATELMKTAPSFEEGLILANNTIERSRLLTSEEKDLALANSVINANPQWYIDNADGRAKELFNKLSPDQKTGLETRARTEINRIRIEQQRASKELNDQTRKSASDRWRKNELTDEWLQANRANMAASDYERYNNNLIQKAKDEKSFQANLIEIQDANNRQIFGALDQANTVAELNELQRTVNQFVSPEQKKLSVEEGKKWTSQINSKLDGLILTEAEGFLAWSKFDDKITATMLNPTKANIDALNKEIDEATIPPPGQSAIITIGQATKLQTRLNGIEKNPAVKTRPSVSRAQLTIGRLRSLQVNLLTAGKDPQFLAGQGQIPTEDRSAQELIITVENSFSRIQTELDAFVNTLKPDDEKFDDKVNDKLAELTRPIVTDVTLNSFERIFSPKEKGFFTLLGLNTEAEELAQEKLDTLKDHRVWKTLSKTERKEAKEAFKNGFTVDDVVKELGQ